MSIRAPGPKELDQIVELVLSALPQDPQWSYRFPYRKQYAKEEREHMKFLFESFLDPANDDWKVMVVKAPSLDDETKMRMVAVSVWDFTYRNKRKHGSEYFSRNCQ